MLLTRLPVAGLVREDMPIARMAWAFPVVGAVVGAIGAAAFVVASWLHLPPTLAAVAAIAAQLFATGGLHEDGLADTADGLGGGRDRARKLEIMRDSRIGAFGALALVLALATRGGSMVAIADPARVAAALIAAGALGRGAMLLQLALLRPARTDGLAHGLGERGIASLLAGGGLALAACGLLPWQATTAAVAGAITGALVLSRLAARQLGGYTGDILGATAAVGECLALAGIAAAARG